MPNQEPNLQVEQVFLTMPCCIWWTDREHKILGCNIETCAAFQAHSPKEILGKTIKEIAYEKDLSEFRANQTHDSNETVMKKGKTVYQILNMIPHHITESAPKRQLGAKQPIFNKNEEVIGLVCVVLFDHDIGPEYKKTLNLLDIEEYKINFHSNVKLDFRKIYDIAPCSLWWMDRKHFYLGCNFECCHICEIDNEKELIGENIYDVCKRRHMLTINAKNIYDLDEFIMQNGISSFNIENTVGHKTKPTICQWAAKRSIINTNNEIIGLTAAGIYNGLFQDLNFKKTKIAS